MPNELRYVGEYQGCHGRWPFGAPKKEEPPLDIWEALNIKHDIMRAQTIAGSYWIKEYVRWALFILARTKTND